MDEMELMIDLHKDGDRQGPGSPEATLQALAFTEGIGPDSRILDIGCGTGGQTLTLGKKTGARIEAVDFLPAFLEILEGRAARAGLGERIHGVRASMEALPYPDGSFDLVWSEGAIYNMGFARGVREWRRLLKSRGFLAVSEICWFTKERPQELTSYWEGLYPEIDTVSGVTKVLEEAGYRPVAHFLLPESCWLEAFYEPLLERLEDFLKRHGHSPGARALVEEHQEEIRMYRKYKEHYGYGFFIAQRTGD
ncbi:class I SAM-dependent methyltransferase [Anaerotalea alkaliphila]|uniref:Methyltransferase domain-containing protein n=1 Tax=Anaerotalea alkaliphila TaxID=2662126 RepID=A0A7X5HW61_9FIRM|nr:class I SAM-dependent methyltransferase [Anaerotalea alkaliphila]NDL67571.1 methyltransferase domain-containing protein [Anaerotalea alkaliphila]